MDFFTSKHPKAKKEHICDLCNEKICIGEKYHRYSGKYEGDLFDDKFHLTCQRIINAYCEAMGDHEYCNDAIEDWLCDIYCHACKHYEYDCEGLFPICCKGIREHYTQEGEE